MFCHVPDLYTCYLSPNPFPLVNSGSAITFYAIKNEWADAKIIHNKNKLFLRSLSSFPSSISYLIASLFFVLFFCLFLCQYKSTYRKQKEQPVTMLHAIISACWVDLLYGKRRDINGRRKGGRRSKYLQFIPSFSLAGILCIVSSRFSFWPLEGNGGAGLAQSVPYLGKGETWNSKANLCFLFF